ncbi:MAG: type II toxin-antitoxin system HicA family toxin [Actinomycetota bacterium]
MPMTYKAVRSILIREGWTKRRQRGSHEIWASPDGRRRTVVAGRDSDIVHVQTLAAIRRQTGMDYLR